jgi:hypothetical protein
MPVFLEPRPPGEVSRRNFLARAAAGAGALFLGNIAESLTPLIEGAEELRGGEGRGEAATPPSHWALLSDTHIDASVREENQGQNMASNLLRVVAEVLQARPAAALVNGDLARNLGKVGDYRSFLKLVEPLRLGGIPLHLTLGNHDDRENFVTVIVEEASGTPPLVEESPVPQKCCIVLERDGVRWLLLDSLEKVNVTPGWLGPEQLDWIGKELDRDPARPVIIFLHHNVEKGSNIALRESDELMAILRPRRQVKAVFFGHTHAWRRWVDDGIHMVNLPAVGYAFGPAEPLGWVRAMPRPEGLEIELRALNAAHPDHGKKIDLAWRPMERP